LTDRSPSMDVDSPALVIDATESSMSASSH
jgi:hypothetical protein